MVTANNREYMVPFRFTQIVAPDIFPLLSIAAGELCRYVYEG
jgi:hypothetical protein